MYKFQSISNIISGRQFSHFVCKCVQKVTLYGLFCLFLLHFPLILNGAEVDNICQSSCQPIAKIATVNQNTDIWPAHCGVHNDGNVSTFFTCYGAIGWAMLSIPIYDPESEDFPTGFNFPINSKNEYALGAALWVGGVIDGDTLASVAANHWGSVVPSFYPEDSINGTAYLYAGPADKNFLVSFTDTVGDLFNESRLKALAVTERSYSFATPPYDDFVIYEMTIKNVSGSTINDTWIGFLITIDALNSSSPLSCSYDNFTGRRKSSGISYVIDNDGDPLESGENYSWYEESIRGVCGFKLLAMSPQPTDTGFNWWIPSNNIENDWGPRYIGDSTQPFYYFSTGGNGRPENAADQYHLLSNSEMDYDYMWMHAMLDDPNWLASPYGGEAYDEGWQSVYLHSFGEFDLPPGDSVTLAFVFAGGENVHVNADDFSRYYNIDLPEMFYSRLDFSDLENNIAAAQQLYDNGFHTAPPLGPAQGVGIFDNAETGLHIEWLERVHPDVEGYNVYVKPVHDSQIYFADTVLGPHDTLGMTLLNPDSTITGTSFHIDGLVDGQMYFVSVAIVSSHGIGRKSRPVYFTFDYPHPPLVDTTTAYQQGSFEIDVNWSAVDDDIAYYKIYKMTNLDDFLNSYGATISTYPTYHGDTYDTSAVYIGEDGPDTLYFFRMEAYDSVFAPALSFIDSASAEELYYFITAVDTIGMESGLSAPIHILARGPVNDRVLIYLPNDGLSSNLQSIDTIMAFYEDAFAQLDYLGVGYDLFFTADSAGSSGCEGYECMGWSTMAPYRMIIFDDNLRQTSLLYNVFGKFTDALSEYRKCGGDLLYFGNLAGDYPGLYIDTLRRYFEPGSFEYDILCLDSMLTMGPVLYTSGAISTEDTLGGLIRALTTGNGLPSLDIDSSRFWWNKSYYPTFYWPFPTPPFSGVLFPNYRGEITHEYHSLYPSSSIAEGHPCGVRNSAGNGSVYSFMFHPWNLETGDFVDLLAAVLNSTAVADSVSGLNLPERFELYPNYPNPFNSSTRIRFNIPLNTYVQIDVYNILGRKVANLFGEKTTAGRHSVIWDGTDHSGHEVASGIYFCRMRTTNFEHTTKMLLLR